MPGRSGSRPVELVDNPFVEAVDLISSRGTSVVLGEALTAVSA
jgi:hypothetical protein